MANWGFIGTIHRGIYRATGGRVGARLAGLDMLLLTTTGRKSGEPRTQPLACFAEGENWIVVASNNGQDKHPAWFLNLEAKPEAQIQIGRADRAVQAHVAEGEERERLWPWLKERNPAYAGYERKTERRIPVVVLRPVA
ncbi:MAG: nitroreductase family deazaflavin-dependent oxidoreductase [Deltaproteobacteria bacterium]|nr:nitroreductase family deazaflavin-dependent oxidoreductase [Deltaproteobacteria bacterium]